jgi:MFS family permease
LHSRPSPNQAEAPFSYPLFFYLIMASTFLFFFSMHLLITPLPLYVKEVGGQPSQIGLVMGVFALTAVLSRPLVGRLVDGWGRKPVMLIGSAIFIVGPLFYTLARSVPSLFLARMFHGIGIAAFTTAYSTLVADLVPPSRRGEALGLAGAAPHLSIMLAPPLGDALLPRLDFSLLFIVSAVVAALSLLVATPIREAARAANPHRAPGFLHTLSERSVWVPSLLTVAVGLTYGSIYVFLPLFGVERGIANVGLFFTAYGIMNATGRIPLGRLSDRVGRKRVIVPAILVLALALGGLNLTRSIGPLIVLACAYGLGFGGAWTAMMALVVDEAPLEVRGMALGVLYACLDLGIGLGGVAMGPLAGTMGYGGMYLILGLIALAGLAVFVGVPVPAIVGPGMGRESPQRRND